MRVKSCAMVLFVLALVVPAAVLAEENVDLQMAMRIRDEAFSNSKVMETAGYLSNVIGPRLTGSPSLERAHQWVKLQLEGLGLENVRLESWGPFGQGWSFDHVSVHMLTPDASLLIAYPRAWTPGTNGVVRGKVMPVVIATEGDFEKYRGKLAGRILLMEPARDLKVHDKADFALFRPTARRDEAVSNACGAATRRSKAARNLFETTKILAGVESVPDG